MNIYINYNIMSFDYYNQLYTIQYIHLSNKLKKIYSYYAKSLLNKSAVDYLADKTVTVDGRIMRMGFFTGAHNAFDSVTHYLYTI